MNMGFRHFCRGSLAAALAVSLAPGLIGCGGASDGSVDRGVVTVYESTSLSVPAKAETTPPSSPTAGAKPSGAATSGMITVSEPSATAAAPSPAASSAEAAAEPAAVAAEPGAVVAEGWGTLKGKVTFGGDAPAAKAMYPKGDKGVKDPAVCAASGAIPDERLVVDPASKGVRYAIVYIPKPTKINPEAEAAAKAAQVVFDQKNCTFVPHVLAFMKGTKVLIKSNDNVGHNVNTQAGLNNNKFNMPTQPMGEMPQLFKQSETKPGKVVCDIHGWMSAYMLVASNPYFAVTDANGNFEIKNAPAGDQKVVVWAEALGPGFVTPASGEVIAIKAGGETAKDFTLDPAKVKLK